MREVVAGNEAVNAGDFVEAQRAYGRAYAIERPQAIAVGDSHVQIFSGFRSVMPMWLGPMTMMKFAFAGRDYLDLDLLGVSDDVKVILSLGEIDVRNHVSRYGSRPGQSYDEVSLGIIRRYLVTVERVTARLPKRNVFIATTVPPHDIPETSPHAWLGAPPLSLRQPAARAFNTILLDLASEAGFGVCDPYGRFGTEDGLMPDALTTDDIHLNLGPGLDGMRLYIAELMGAD